MKFPSESEIRAKYKFQNPGSKNGWIRNPLPLADQQIRRENFALNPKSEQKYFQNPPIRWPIHPPMSFYETQGMSKLKQDSACARCVCIG